MTDTITGLTDEDITTTAGAGAGAQPRMAADPDTTDAPADGIDATDAADGTDATDAADGTDADGTDSPSGDPDTTDGTDVDGTDS